MFSRKIAIALAFLSSLTFASAQTAGTFQAGKPLPAATLNSAFAAKQDWPLPPIANTGLATMPTASVKCSLLGGVPADCTQAQITSLINLFSATASGAVPPSGGGTTTFLRADGAFAAPVSPGQVISIVTYSTSQTITIPAGAHSAHVKMTGGTGGSGGTGTTCSSCVTTNTFASGYLEKYLSGLTPGNTLVFTLGAAGSGGVAGGSGNSGGNGTASTLASGTQTISTLTANGTSGSLGVNGANGFGSTPGSGGTATGGDINVTAISSINFYSTGALGLNGVGASVAGNLGNPGVMIIIWFS